MNEIKSTPMNHDQVVERLPWFVSGSLDAEERGQVEEHLKGCQACQAELQATQEAFDVFDAHLPTEVLVSHAWGDDTGWPREIVERHLESCPSCAEELSMVQAGRQNLEAPSPFDPPRDLPRTLPAATGWRVAALAATVVMAVGLGGWWLTWQSAQGQTEMLAQERAALEARVESLETANAQVDGQVAQLRSEAERLAEERDRARRELEEAEQRIDETDRRPRVLGAPVVLELFAGVVRGGETDLPVAEVPGDALLVLSLTTPWDQEAGPFRVQVSGNGRPMYETEQVGWEPGYLNVVVPASEIPQGEVSVETIALGADESRTYRFQRVSSDGGS